MATIHPTAIVDPQAKLDNEVTVGPYAIIGPHVTIGAGTEVQAHAFVSGHTTIGQRCQIFPFACVGEVPQDLKFKGERTRLIYKLPSNQKLWEEYARIQGD